MLWRETWKTLLLGLESTENIGLRTKCKLVKFLRVKINRELNLEHVSAFQCAAIYHVCLLSPWNVLVRKRTKLNIISLKCKFIQTSDYYSVVKWNEFSSHEKIWKNLKHILLSERSHYEKATYYVTSTMWHSRRGKTRQTVKRSVLTRGLEGCERDK